MRQRDWRRDGNPDDLAEGGDNSETSFDPRDMDGLLQHEEVRQLLLQETLTRAKAAELSAFRYFEREGASDDEWRLLLMDTPPTIH